MEKISKSLDQRTIGTTGLNKFNTIVTIEDRDKVRLTKQEVLGCDIGLGDYKDVMHPDFYRWYCKAWYKLGRAKFDQLASVARADGKEPAKLFSKLVKAELQK